MNTVEERIAQWEQMAREAPDDMAFFSLGNAYRDAERFEDAAGAFAKAIELNPNMSRAYQLHAQVLLKLDRNDAAAETLEKGYTVAAERGDVMPQRAMASLLQKLGKPLPEVEAKAEEVDLGEDQIIDRRTGRPQPRLAGPPMRGPTGRFIYDHFGQHTWREWIGQGTKVINELRLDFSNPQHQDTYDQYMLEWLQVTPDEIEEYAKKKSS
jgi:Fe-S cluster biosynthesis and repair protein YggX